MAEIIKRTDDEVTIQVTIKTKGSMLEREELIQQGVNEVGAVATKDALASFDATGAPINVGTVRMTSKGKEPKEYETPYGKVKVQRYVYQTSKGGKIFCPLDERARILIHSTPKFAKMISNKYASLSATDVSKDLGENHSRPITKGFVKKISDYIGAIVQSSEEFWEYEIPDQKDTVSTISVSLDGT